MEQASNDLCYTKLRWQPSSSSQISFYSSIDLVPSGSVIVSAGQHKSAVRQADIPDAVVPTAQPILQLYCN